MSVTPDDAVTYLGLNQNGDDLVNLQLVVDAANEWVASKVADTTPNPVKLGTLELIRHWWEVQRGPSAVPLDDEYESIGVAGYGIPNRVKQMLEPYFTTTSGAPQGAGSFPAARAWPDPVEAC